MSFAEGLISIFVPIYLYNLNYSIIDILLYYLLVSICILILINFLVKFISKIGVKHSISISIPFLIIYFLGLNILENTPFLFFVLPIILAARTIFYNIGYHLNYLEHSNAKKRGKEISILVSLPLLASLLSPLLGGLLITYFDYHYLYATGSIILAASILPLLLSGDQKEKMNFRISDAYKLIVNKKNRNTMISFMGYAPSATIGVVIWPIFLITILTNVKSVGFVASLTSILTLAIFFFIEKRDDKRSKKDIIKKRSFLHVLGWIARIFASSTLSAFLIDTYKKLSFKLLHVQWSSYAYSIAKRQNYFKFVVAREIFFNISRIVIIPILILAFYYLPVLLAFTATFLLAAILSTLYPFIIKKDRVTIKTN